MTESTHRCNCRYFMCAGSDTCEIEAPEHDGKTFRSRCGSGFFVRYIPIRPKIRDKLEQQGGEQE